MPPVLGPLSPSPTRLKSCAASSGTTVVPSTTQNNDTSGPSRKDSNSTGCPVSSRLAACARATSRSGVTTTPLPAASRSSFTTHAGSPAATPNRASAASKCAGLSTISLAAVRTPAAAITSLANAFEPSIRAASSEGPKQATPASRSASATPSTSGISGPMTTRSERTRWASSTTSSAEVMSTGCCSAISAVPALPGATKSASTCGSSRKANNRACSRAPEPITRTRTTRHPNGECRLVERLTRVHLDRRVDVGLLVVGGSFGGGLLTPGRYPFDHAVQPRAEREPDVVGQKDGHFAQFVLGQLPVLQCGVDLNLGEVLLPERGDNR